MDVRIFVRNIEDFLNKKIEKEFLEYKLNQLKKKFLSKKKDALQDSEYFKILSSILIILENINSNISDRNNKPLFENYIKELKDANNKIKNINIANKKSTKKHMDRDNLTTRKIKESYELKDDKVDRLRDELDSMSMSSTFSSIKLPGLPSKKDDFTKASPKLVTTIPTPHKSNKYSTVELGHQIPSDNLKISSKSSNTKSNTSEDYSGTYESSLKASKKTKFNISKILPELDPKKQNFRKLRKTFEVFNDSMDRSSGRKTADLEESETWEEDFTDTEIKSKEYSPCEAEQDSTLYETDASYSENVLGTFESSSLDTSLTDPFNTKSPETCNTNNVKEQDNIPVSSPLYSMLTSYEDLKNHKIIFHDWANEQSIAEEQLGYLLEQHSTKDLEQDEVAKLFETINLALSVIDEVKTTSQEIIRDWNRREIYDSTGRYQGQKKEDRELKELLDDLREFNIEIYNIDQIIAHSVKEESSSILSIKEHMKLIPEEEYETENYIFLKNTAHNFSTNKIPQEQFLLILSKACDMIEDMKVKYDMLQIAEDEITLEVFRGNTLLSEGLEGWEQGLIILKEYVASKDKDDINDGLRMIYEGNKKLVFMQHFAQDIQKQAQSQRFQTDFSTTKELGFS